MSAQDNLSRQLFHGTIETLKPGDVIKPRGNGTDHDTSGVAWATSDLNYALDHAKDRVRSGFGAKPGGEYPVHHGNVYEVEPVSDYKPGEYANTFVGKQFKVKHQVASVLGEEDNLRAIKRNFPSFDPSKASYVERGRERVFE